MSNRRAAAVGTLRLPTNATTVSVWDGGSRSRVAELGLGGKRGVISMRSTVRRQRFVQGRRG